MGFSVGDMAELADVTVRLLHHYDDIGLLRPHDRSPSGHRRYDDADAARLRRILTYRALGFSLAEIARILDDPRADAGTHLRRQHHLLGNRIDRLQRMLAAVEDALDSLNDPNDPNDPNEEESMTFPRIVPTPEQQRELLGEVVFTDDWAASVTRSSGTSAAFRESARRIADYTDEDWQQIMDDERSVCARLADIMASGASPDSDEAVDLAEEHRGGLRRWFFDCTPEAHGAFADMFVTDDAMRATFEAVSPGLTDYLAAAIHANRARIEGSS